MRRRHVPPARHTRPSLLRPRGLRLEWLEDRTVPTGLTLSVANEAFLEGSGTTATLTRTAADLSQPLTVWLDASDPSEVTFPASVVIPAGQASASFPVDGVDDTDREGVQYVNLFANADDPPVFSSASVSVRVFDNDSPLDVRPDSYDTTEDYPLTVYGLGVLSNDSSTNGDLTVSLETGPSHGTLSLSPGGGFTYTPVRDYFGPDSFTYRATDPAGLSGTATVSLTVWGMDDPIRLTVPGPQATAEDTPVTFGTAFGNAITVTDIESPRVLVDLLASDGVLTLRSTAGLEFPYPGSTNNSETITFYADDPAEANAALEHLVLSPNADFNGTTYLYVYVRDMTPGGTYPAPSPPAFGSRSPR